MSESPAPFGALPPQRCAALCMTEQQARLNNVVQDVRIGSGSDPPRAATHCPARVRPVAAQTTRTACFR